MVKHVVLRVPPVDQALLENQDSRVPTAHRAKKANPAFPHQ